MFSVLRKTKKLNLPVDMQLQMFDAMVAPILLYGAEVYGYEKSDITESLFLQFYKIIMCLKKLHQMLFCMGSWVDIHQKF